jgi:RHH-type proline utilization regulon transcriptional repressor/proline dehydrogenase/delta 1-pyrroline-5-carboxylate dehydrogenase
VTRPFQNQPLLDLRRAPEREALLSALRGLDERLPIDVPVIIGGEVRTGVSLESVDPGVPGRLVARAASATAADVNDAVALAGRACRDWAGRAAEDRAAILSRAAGELRGARHELAALQVRESAKPWVQADADVCEAIDFLEYYAQQAIVLDRGADLVQLPGERNTLHYRPRGVVAVIAPWNFPMAIATGMTAAALATGNAVCLKPAEQSPACAHAVVGALYRAGVPAGALALLPGAGEVGAALVEHPGIHTIAFTGSEAVGRRILATASRPVDGQTHLKRVVAELGGKNCVIVDYDADLDDVVPALLDSAFAFAGQKCSAASRVLVHERIFDALADRLCGALQTLAVGPAEDFGTDVPPVIDAESRDRIEVLLAEAASGAALERVTDLPGGDGFWVAPTVVTGAGPESPLIRNEIFGPVLSLEPVPSVACACDVVDGQPQALTGGLFTRNPRTIAEVVRRSPVGNLYINRGTTGAMVGRQPFGGNRMSGTGTKAGGPDYLLSFVEPLVVTENTVRHGLPV